MRPPGVDDAKEVLAKHVDVCEDDHGTYNHLFRRELGDYGLRRLHKTKRCDYSPKNSISQRLVGHPQLAQPDRKTREI